MQSPVGPRDPPAADASDASATQAREEPDSLDVLLPEHGSSGETVLDQRALRFRSLTLAEADLSALEAPAGFHNGFKIRVAKLSGRRREAGDEDTIGPQEQATWRKPVDEVEGFIFDEASGGLMVETAAAR